MRTFIVHPQQDHYLPAIIQHAQPIAHVSYKCIARHRPVRI